MTDRIPLKKYPDSGSPTSLSEFQPGDTVAITFGGTGATTATGARAALGAYGSGSSVTLADGVFSGSTTGPLVRITQTGAGDALLVEDSASTDSTPFVVKGDGKVGIGVSSPTNHVEAQAASGSTYVESITESALGGFVASVYNAPGAINALRRATGSKASPTAVGNGSVLSRTLMQGYGATGFKNAAEIKVTALETFTDSTSAAKMEIMTTPSGSTTPVVAVTIGSNQTVTHETGTYLQQGSETPSANAVTVDLAKYSHCVVDAASAACTYSFTNMVSGYYSAVLLEIANGDSAAQTFTNVTFAATPTFTAGEKTFLVIWSREGGATNTIYGAQVAGDTF